MRALSASRSPASASFGFPGTSRRHSTRASEASERSGAKRSGGLFDCRSQLFSSKDAPYFDFESRFFALRVCVWKMFYNMFEYF